MKPHWPAGLIVFALLPPQAAQAHSPIEGAGEFYSGLLHPVLVPTHILVLSGLGLWLGQQESRRIEPALLVFAPSLLLGLALSNLIASPPALETILLALALIVGGLVAAEKPGHKAALAALAGLCGLALGIDSSSDSDRLGATIIVLSGTWIGAHLILLNLLAITSFAKRAWMKIGVRVVGSWIAASAIIVLALAFRQS